jgi:sugar phosphate isomerase/epimerase
MKRKVDAMKLAYPFMTAETKTPLMALRGDTRGLFFELKALGYHGIELYVRDPKEIDKNTLNQALSANELELAAVSTAPIQADDNLTFTSSNPRERKEAVQRVKAVIDLAAAYKAPVSIGKIRGNLAVKNRETTFQWIREALQEAGEYAAELEVELAIEPQNRNNLNVLNTSSEVLELIADLKIPSLKIMLDTYHMHLSEPNITKHLHAAKEKLIFMHLADANRTLTEGEIDFAEVLKMLQVIGYDGYLSMEIKQEPTGVEAAKEAIEYLTATTQL